VDIASDLIRLSGLTPDHDVEIEFTGIRPGEKLFEELFLGQEGARRTEHPRIFVGQAATSEAHTSACDIERLVKELGELAESGEVEPILAKFKEIVPEYCYQQVRVDPAADSPVEPMHAGAALPLEPSPQRTPSVAVVSPTS
jgi:O-antigen biosynthesis protein WbqV